MATIEELKNAGIPIDEDDPEAMLRVEAAIEYINENTTLKADFNDMESIKSLSAPARLFIVKFGETMSAYSGVTSESLGGMSQSFGTDSYENMLLDLLDSLLGAYRKSSVTVLQAKNKWRQCR